MRRLDRVEEINLLDARFDPAPRPALDELVHAGRAFRAEAAGKLRVQYSPKIARWIAERDASDAMTAEGPG